MNRLLTLGIWVFFISLVGCVLSGFGVIGPMTDPITKAALLGALLGVVMCGSAGALALFKRKSG